MGCLQETTEFSNQNWPIFVKDAKETPKTNRFGGHSNLLCPINQHPLEIR